MGLNSEDIFETPALFGSDDEFIANLFDEFVMPPFSILDRKGGKWQSRKRQWLRLGILSELGRDDELIFTKVKDSSPEDGKRIREATDGTSVFDPVLVECAVKWFSPKDALVLDPFAGGSVRGIVTSLSKRHYIGIDLREEQVESNRSQLEIANADYPPTWIAGNSSHIRFIAKDWRKKADLIFSCPPYFDLEVYSDREDDLSNMSWPNFQYEYQKIIKDTCNLLNENRFAVWIIGETRDSKGLIRGLVPETIAAFKEAGLSLYNNAITADPQASSALRAGPYFRTGRKLVTVYQHFLVFVKGDWRKAAEFCNSSDSEE